jgi:predicted alpha/beta hydrolase family esterase
VAPPWLDETNLPIHSFLPPPLDRKSLSASAGNIKLIYSLADPVCPKTARVVFETSLALNGICLPEEAGHINLDSGYGPWPEMLEWCLAQD